MNIFQTDQKFHKIHSRRQRPLSSQDRRRAEMVRDVLTDQNGTGSAANSPAVGSDADGRTAAGHTAEAEPLDFFFHLLTESSHPSPPRSLRLRRPCRNLLSRSIKVRKDSNQRPHHNSRIIPRRTRRQPCQHSHPHRCNHSPHLLRRKHRHNQLRL